MGSQEVLGQATRLASSSALLQVRARPGAPSSFSWSVRGGGRLNPALPAGVPRAAFSTGAVPGGHVRAERVHSALPLQGADRRGQREVRGVLQSTRAGEACVRHGQRTVRLPRQRGGGSRPPFVQDRVGKVTDNDLHSAV